MIGQAGNAKWVRALSAAALVFVMFLPWGAPWRADNRVSPDPSEAPAAGPSSAEVGVPAPESRTESSSVTMEVFPSPAPNVFGSTPGWAGYVPNALDALEHYKSAVGDPALTPTAYYRALFLDERMNIVTTFPSWNGYANPGSRFGAAFASEEGNRITFGLHILGNGTKVKLSNLSRVMHSSDPSNIFAYTSNFLTASYSDRIVGIDYGPDGIKGTADDVRIISGLGTQAVDEIIYVGGGNAMANDEADCPGSDDTTMTCVANQ